MKAIEFTLTISPCMNCSMCPQDKLAAAYQGTQRVMTMANFMTILDKLPLDVVADFSGFSEPFLNPLAVEMMRRATDKGHQVRLFTTLSGFQKAQVETLALVPLNYVRLHVPDATGFKMNTDRWLERYELFKATGHKYSAMCMTDAVDPLIEQALNRDGVKVERPTMLSRAGNLGWVEPNLPLVGPITCNASRWFQNVVLPNGAVAGCCNLYSLEIVLGNLLCDSYEFIYAKALEWSQDTNPPDDSPCRKCSWAKPI